MVPETACGLMRWAGESNENSLCSYMGCDLGEKTAGVRCTVQ